MRLKLLKNLISISFVFLSFIGNGQKVSIAVNPNVAYQPPAFTDAARLQKLQAFFPLIEKMYKSYAEQNHFPGYSFGVMLDGELIFSGSGGYTDIDKKITATTQSMFRIACNSCSSRLM